MSNKKSMTKMSKLWDDIESQNDEILSQSNDVKSQHFKENILTKGIHEIIIQIMRYKIWHVKLL